MGKSPILGGFMYFRHFERPHINIRLRWRDSKLTSNDEEEDLLHREQEEKEKEKEKKVRLFLYYFDANVIIQALIFSSPSYSALPPLPFFLFPFYHHRFIAATFPPSFPPPLFASLSTRWAISRGRTRLRHWRVTRRKISKLAPAGFATSWRPRPRRSTRPSGKSSATRDTWKWRISIPRRFIPFNNVVVI